MFNTFISVVFGDMETALNTLWAIVCVSILVAYLWFRWQYKPNYQGLREDIVEIREDIVEIREDIVKIKQKLSKIDGVLYAICAKLGIDTISVLSGAASPINLTDYGKLIAEQIGVEDIVSEHKERIHIEPTNTAYQIQEKCYEYVESIQLSPEHSVTIDNIAYEEGIKRFDIIKAVVGLSLRNKILEDCAKAISNVGSKDKTAHSS